MKRLRIEFWAPLAVMGILLSASSCKKDESVTARITVMHDSIQPAGTDSSGLFVFDTITSPVVGAEVRLWGALGSLIDETILTDVHGLAEISFD